MKKALLIVPALMVSHTALAQNLAANPDMGTYRPQTVTYPAGNLAPVVGDGSNPAGGIAPAFTLHPEPDESWDIPDPQWTSGTVDPNDYCLVDVAPSNCAEKKFRTIVESSITLPDDMIRVWCRPGQSHWHEFFGNRQPAACSTRASLRRKNTSTAPGNTAQSTPYWEPGWLFDGPDGNTYAHHARENVVYYTGPRDETNSQVNHWQYLHTLLGFVGGVKPEDPDDDKVKAEIAAANAQPNTWSGRYSYRTNGFVGYACTSASGQTTAQVKGGGQYTKSFVLADGTDPWEGRCTDGMLIYAEGNSPECWDGYNVMSLTGYDHFRYKIGDNNTGKLICPSDGTKGFWEVPSFELKSLHATRGWLDYKRWYLASDAMMEARLTYLGKPRKVLPGESFHFDWKNGWNKIVLHNMMDNCLGLKGQPHQCNNNVYGPGLILKKAFPSPAPVDTFNLSTVTKIGPTRAIHVQMHHVGN